MSNESNIYYPDRLVGAELDQFLEMGWYRMGQSIFTTHFTLLDGYLHRVFWLRYNLRTIKFTPAQRRIWKQDNRFDLSIKRVQISDEMEELYSRYKLGIDFEGADSVKDWLFGDRPHINAFTTEMIHVRDQEKLIAVGITDRGSKSIAGILNFYDPSYKKYSLGKYLMIMKIIFGKMRNSDWYYPGYIVYQRPQFDYKLSFDKNSIEVLIPEREGWLKYDRQLIDKYGVAIDQNLTK